MKAIVNLYSNIDNEINNFLNKFYDDIDLKENNLKWEKEFENPIEIADIIGTFIDNNDKFKINMWISIDEGFFINVNDGNANEIIKYLYERFPY